MRPIVSGQIGYLSLHVRLPHDRRADRQRKAYAGYVPTLILYFAHWSPRRGSNHSALRSLGLPDRRVSGPKLYFFGVSFRTSR
jgi:hypothetical protein